MVKLFNLLQNELSTEEFRATVRKTFVKCGITPSSGAAEQIQFKQFNPKQLTGVSKYVPPDSSKHDLTRHDTVVPVAEQHEVVADLIDGYIAGEYDSDDEER